MNRFAQALISIKEYYNSISKIDPSKNYAKFKYPLLILINAYEHNPDKLCIIQDVCDEYIDCEVGFISNLKYVNIKNIYIPKKIEEVLNAAAEREKENISNPRAARINQNIHKLLDK